MSMWTERRTIVTYALSLLALVEIIDFAIVAVVIPDLMGALGANINNVSLTMTSYIVAAAICIPLTGLITTKYGIKNIALLSILLFGISSILCGTATSLPQMIIYRIFQGVGGAFLPALVQAYVVKKYSEQEQPTMMGLVTICIVLGPIIGPIMGGYIVQHMSWSWIFYVNIPICILSFMLIFIFMDKDVKKEINIDYISFTFMAIGLGCLEYFIDEGNTNNWFESFEMISFLVTAIISISFFIWRGLLGSSVVNFRIFSNFNFVFSCFVIFLFFALLSSGLTYFSAMLQNVYGMPVDTAGYLQAPRGVAAVIGAPIYMLLSKKIDARVLMIFAIILTGFASFATGFMSTTPNYTLIILLMIMQGFGMIGVFVPLMSITYIGVPDAESADCSGVFNFARNFSSSIGAAIAATLISRNQQVVWNDLGTKISYYATGFRYWSQNLIGTPFAKVPIQGSALFVRQASILQSYLDMFYLTGIGLIVLCWMPLLLKRPDPNATPHMGH